MTATLLNPKTDINGCAKIYRGNWRTSFTVDMVGIGNITELHINMYRYAMINSGGNYGICVTNPDGSSYTTLISLGIGNSGEFSNSHGTFVVTRETSTKFTFRKKDNSGFNLMVIW